MPALVARTDTSDAPPMTVAAEAFVGSLLLNKRMDVCVPVPLGKTPTLLEVLAVEV